MTGTNLARHDDTLPHYCHQQNPASLRQSAGVSFFSRFCDKLSLGQSVRKLHPSQLGEEDAIDEDVAAEVHRIQRGAGDEDMVKVTDHGGGRIIVRAIWCIGTQL